MREILATMVGPRGLPSCGVTTAQFGALPQVRAEAITAGDVRLTDFDIDRLRAETPACGRLVHLNNAGASLMPQPVLTRLLTHLQAEADFGPYEAAEAVADEIEGVHASLAELIGASPPEIALMESGTHAWRLAAHALPLKAGDRIVVHATEYLPNLHALRTLAAQRGLVIDCIGSSGSPIDPDQIRAVLHPRTRLIALTHSPSFSGLLHPAAEVGRFAKDHGLLFMLDACQTVGQLPIDVTSLGVDLLVSTGRKFLRAPRGTAFLYARHACGTTLTPGLFDADPSGAGGALGARRLQSWESAIAARLALGCAAQYALAIGLDVVAARNRHLGRSLRDALEDSPCVEVLECGRQESATVTFRKRDETAAALMTRLRSVGVNVSVAPPAVTCDDNRTGQAVRVSPHYFNTTEELERAVLEIGRTHA